MSLNPDEWPSPKQSLERTKTDVHSPLNEYGQLPCMFTCGDENWENVKKYEDGKVHTLLVKEGLPKAKCCDMHFKDTLVSGVWIQCSHPECYMGIVSHNAKDFERWGTASENHRLYWCLSHYNELSVKTPADIPGPSFISLIKTPTKK